MKSRAATRHDVIIRIVTHFKWNDDQFIAGQCCWEMENTQRVCVVNTAVKIVAAAEHRLNNCYKIHTRQYDRESAIINVE